MRLHCCDTMTSQMELSCSVHEDVSECPDALIGYSPMFDEYGIRVHDGGTSWVEIHHCPWCGSRLPASRREEWFDRLEALGFENPWDEPIPAEFLSDAWYRGA